MNIYIGQGHPLHMHKPFGSVASTHSSIPDQALGGSLHFVLHAGCAALRLRSQLCESYQTTLVEGVSAAATAGEGPVGAQRPAPPSFAVDDSRPRLSPRRGLLQPFIPAATKMCARITSSTRHTAGCYRGLSPLRTWAQPVSSPVLTQAVDCALPAGPVGHSRGSHAVVCSIH